MKNKNIKFLGIFLVGLVMVSMFSGCIDEEEKENTPSSGIYKETEIFNVSMRDPNNKETNSTMLELEKIYSFKLEVEPIGQITLYNVLIDIKLPSGIELINTNQFPVELEYFGNEKKEFQIRIKVKEKVGGNILVIIKGLRNNNPFEREYYFYIRTEGLSKTNETFPQEGDKNEK